MASALSLPWSMLLFHVIDTLLTRHRTLATLIPLADDGYATLLPDGSYKLRGDPGDRLWWAMKLCRFGPGELDPYVPSIRRLPDDAPILPGLWGADG